MRKLNHLLLGLGATRTLRRPMVMATGMLSNVDEFVSIGGPYGGDTCVKSYDECLVRTDNSQCVPSYIC